MKYEVLSKPFPIWVPIYEVKLDFQIGTLGDKLDALPLLILFMLDDHKSVEDITMVTQLNATIIEQEISRMQQVGLLREEGDLRPSELGRRILQIYRLADCLSQEPQPFYVDTLNRKLHLYQSNDIVSEEEPVGNSFIHIKETSISQGCSKSLFSGTYNAVQVLLDKQLGGINSDEFNYLVYVGEKKYLQRYIRKLPIWGYEATEPSSLKEAVQCEFTYHLYVLPFEGQPYIFYLNPVTHELMTKKAPVPVFSSKKGSLCFENTMMPERELEIIRTAIQKSVQLEHQEIPWENLRKYQATLRGYADAGEIFGGGNDET